MPIFKIFFLAKYSSHLEFFGCNNSIRLETEHFVNTLALTFITFSGRFVFAMQKHYLFFCERSSSFIPIFLIRNPRSIQDGRLTK